MKKFILFIFFIFISNSCLSDKLPDISYVYKSTIEKFNYSYSSGDYSKAAFLANKLLRMDPSDPVAYLRFVVSIEKIGPSACNEYDCIEVKNYISRETDLDREVNEISDLILGSILSKNNLN